MSAPLPGDPLTGSAPNPRRRAAVASVTRRAVMVAGIYGVFATLWIYFSDRALSAFVADPAALVKVSVYKGVGFVLVTAVLLLLLMRRAFGAIESSLATLQENRRQLRESEELLTTVVTTALDAILAADGQGRLVLFNAAAEKLFRCSAHEVLGQPLTQFVPECDGLTGRTSVITQARRATGETFSAEVSVAEIDSGGVALRTVILRDVSERLAREHEIERLSWLYAALSQVNQAIVMTKSRDELLQKVCEVLVHHGGFRLAWIGWEEADSHRLKPVACCGDDNDYVAGLTIYTDDRPEGRGPSGTAFRENRPYLCNDMLDDPATLPWRPEIIRRGLRSSAVFPIHGGGRVVAVLNVYSGEPGFFRDKEIALLVEAAGDISFALENFERDELRRQAEMKVRHERDFSDAMLNSLPGMLYLYDQNGRFLRWNKNLERMTGYTASEIAALHPLDLFHGPDREQVAARIQEVFMFGQSSVEAGLVGKDGRVTPCFFTGITIQFEGRPCLIGVGIDISARIAAEEARIASEQRYHTLFEQAPDGIVIADAQSNYLEANASMCRMLGYTRAELVRLNAVDIVAPSQTARIDPVLRELGAQNDHHREWLFRRKDGSVFPAEVIATKMPDGNLLGMIRDITERKQAERALWELNQTLEQKVATRTEELRAAAVRAEAADRLKSAFLATMSHELRTPLNSIIGFTGIILQGLAGPLNAEQTKQLGMVRGSARHLLELINDVLDISKIEAGEIEVRAEKFDLPASIERVIHSVKPLAEKKGLTLSLVLDPSLRAMVSDRRRVEQILLNLVNNALKFTEQGSVTLTITPLAEFRAQLAAAPVPAVSFRVADTGIGIKPADLAKLFQPFRQIDSGLTRVHEGTGLGLAICRRLAHLLGGEISVASEWTQGSVFTVTLPVQPPPAP